MEERCKKFLSETRDRLKNLEDKAVKWKKIEKQCAKIDKELQDLKKDVKAEKSEDSNPDLNGVVQTLFNEHMEEEKEKDRRCKNVILHGIAEATKENSQDRLEEDSVKVSEVFGFLNVEYEVKKLQRLGRWEEGAKPRPLMAQLPDSICCVELCKQASKLRQAPDSLKGIYIQPDRTQKQRVHRAELVKELKKKQDEGDSTWKIQNDKLVQKRSHPAKSNDSEGPRSFRKN